ncbi:MAG: DNA helicase RecQ [Deltaproteobacteria bacterium]|nr:DNA helicase RecQ [Deltaproteobacteria bacterium]
MIDQIRDILKGVFGYETFWPLQEQVIGHLLEKKDALVVMPTGGGKSLCYQIPSLIFEGLTIVVSPLISLMKDQVDQVRECGVPAVLLNSSLSIEEYRCHVSQLRANRVKLLYLAPESLLTPRIMALLSSLKVDCIAIDEAHCISEWGHDFRPEYRQLAEFRTKFPGAVCVALTATATPRVREDIRKSLNISDLNEFIGSFNRPNLFLEVIQKTAPIEQTLEFLKRYANESGIIYCFSRQQTDDLHTILQRKGYSVRPYHAGLSDRERTENQELFIRDDIQIIVATIAFGMGINKSNVRFVVHYDLPRSIDNYYQEIGRAGRDGLPAHCLLLFGYGDIRKIKYFINQKTQQEQMVANILLNTFIGFAETDLCRRIPLLNYFDENDTPKYCGMCDNCQVEATDLVDLTIPAQMFLSCVKRAGEYFGAGHIIDVLRGSSSQKVLKFGHDQLSTYGIGTAHSTKQWRNMSRQFIQKGLLIYDYDHGTLKLTQKAWEVLKGKEIVRGRREEGKIEKGEVLGQREGESGPHDAVLFEILRKKRKELADLANLPPFTIFHDRTLKEMAFNFPQTREELSTIYGIGVAKLEKYSDTFLRIIEEYCQAHQLVERPKTIRRN